MSTRGSLWLAAALGALLLGLACAVTFWPRRVVEIPASHFAPGVSSPWVLDLDLAVPAEARPPRWLATLRPDGNSDPQGSRLILLEDGVPAGEPHRVHADLQSGVAGWSHWSQWLLVATPDGSDPRTNGRRYQLDLAFSPPLAVRWLGFGLGPLLMLAPFAGALWARGRSTAARAKASAAFVSGVAALAGVGIGVAAIGPLVLSPAGGRERWIVALLFLVGGASARAALTSPGVRIVTRGMALLLGLFAATASINAPLAEFARIEGAATLETLAPWVALALVALAWFRPSALALLVALVGWRRAAGAELTGFPDVNADWLPLAVGAAAMSGGIVAHAWFDLRDGVILRALRLIRPASAAGVDRSPESAEARPSTNAPSSASSSVGRSGDPLAVAAPTVLGIVVPLIAALQLGNYLAAAFEKIRISPRWFDWIVLNHTEHLVLVSEALGAARPLPIAAVGTAHDLMSFGRVALNTAIMLVELLPLVAFLRLRFAVATLAALAAMHLGIFMVTGLCFWKWTLLDVTLAAALWRMRFDPPAPWRMPLVLLLSVVTVVWTQGRWAVTLGWFDTPALNRVTYQVILDDGRVVDVPPTFFRCGSYIVACGNFPRLGVEHFSTDTWATTDDSAVRDLAATRSLPLAEASRFAERAEAAGIASILRRHHAWALEQADSEGRISPARWPHHIWSNTTRFGAFDDVDLRRVVAYRLVAESIYLERAPDGLLEVPALRGELVVPLETPAPGGAPSAE